MTVWNTAWYCQFSPDIFLGNKATINPLSGDTVSLKEASDVHADVLHHGEKRELRFDCANECTPRCLYDRKTVAAVDGLKRQININD